VDVLRDIDVYTGSLQVAGNAFRKATAIKLKMSFRIIAAAGLLFFFGYRLNSDTSAAELYLVERSYSAGAIGDTLEVTHVYKLVNTGDDSLTISDVSTSCGCTVTLIDKKQIASGDTARLKVTLDPKGKGIGEIEKTIWITSNSRTNPYDSLTISAQIQAVHAKAMMTVKNIFAGDCRKCHVIKGEGKLGVDLFNADCLMCHTTSPKSHAPHLGKLMGLDVHDSTLYRMIAEGKPSTNMPAYATAHGGPLSEEQIASLVTMLRRK
jgi:cytochrome c553